MTTQLTSFNIQNFRSIVNSGWRSLSNDNITVLIGQNESGKTSVLEALNSFYAGKIHDDVVRSDNSLPIVGCHFQTKSGENLFDLLDVDKVPNDLKSILTKQIEFKLTREWKPDKSSILYISDGEVFEYFKAIQTDKSNGREKTLNEVDNLLSANHSILQELKEAEQEKERLSEDLINAKKDLDKKRKLYKRTRKTEQKIIAEKEAEVAEKKYNSLEREFKGKDEVFQRIHAKSINFSERIAVGKACKHALEKKTNIEKKRIELTKRISELEHLHELSSNTDSKSEIKKVIVSTKADLAEQTKDLTGITRDIEFTALVASKVYIGNMEIPAAEKEAVKTLEDADKFYNMYSLAEALFGSIPVFEFFEDFSGLLPNRIDLEDLLNENTNAEGYKAAQNFLKLAGLESSFFREKNQRILKQKIETLNTDVTVDFQDYWSQQIGKDNKIKLHFELEHYDYTLTDKSGKPYLEFWIKDNIERLYPKQRSRGVRWFLSFYLELKASVKENNSNRVLLIDEPGLSLHARAQEDVLKVFEDLKDTMQIVYCTHSPHLVKSEKLYRVLAVQRANEEDDKSESLFYDPSMLSEVSSDTLTPIYSLMGVQLSEQQVIRSTKNIILPDTTTYYYVQWLSKLFPELSDIQFIPATGLQTMPLLINIVTGWQLNFGALLFGQQSNEVYAEILETTLLDTDKIKHKVCVFKSFDFIEDIFSALDFKKFILQKRVGITEKNSEFILINSLSRRILAANFVNSFNEGNIKLNTFDETSQTNIKNLFDEIKLLLKPNAT